MNVIVDNNGSTNIPVMLIPAVSYPDLVIIRKPGVDINNKIDRIKKLDRRYIRDTSATLRTKDIAAQYKYTLQDTVEARRS